jgi:hypothetical protein
MFDHFGWSVSISGDGNTIAVGAPFADKVTNADQGSAHIFRRSGSKQCLRDWDSILLKETEKRKELNKIDFRFVFTFCLTNDAASFIF